MSLGVKHNRFYTAKREGYVFDYVKQYLIDKYGVDTVRRGGLRVDTTIDLHLQKLARKALDGNLGAPDRAGAIVTIDPQTGYVRAMASSSRYGDSKFNLAAAGPPPGRLDLQGHGPHGRAAPRRGPQPHELRLAPLCSPGWLPTAPSYEVQTYSHSLRRLDEPRHGDAEVRQLRLRAARRRPRPRVGGQDRARHGHHEPAARLPGRGPGRPDQRRLPAGDGARVRDDRQRRLSREADRRAQGHLPRRPRRRPRQAEPHQGLRGRRGLRGHQILEKNVQGGTGTAAQIGCPAAGKTGTVDNFTDAWFVGFTPRLVTSVWVGHPKDPYPLGPGAAGGAVAAPIWGALHEVGPGQVLRRLPQAQGPVLGPAVLRQVLAHRRPRTSKPAVDAAARRDAAGRRARPPTARATGKDGGGTKYPPDAYEAPPQQTPNTHAAAARRRRRRTRRRRPGRRNGRPAPNPG